MAVSPKRTALPSVFPGGLRPSRLIPRRMDSKRGRVRPRSLLALCLLAISLPAGCANRRYENTARAFDRPTHASNDTLAAIWFKTCYVYPGRDYLTLSWAGRALFGDEAWNVEPDGEVADGPFFANRDTRAVSPASLLADPFHAGIPVSPWHITRRKDHGATPGFVGQDATGRTFFVKLDDPDYPELGTSTEIIGSRIYWLLGYHVPPTYLIALDGTGDDRFDGKRATASLAVPGNVLGGFPFDRFSLRREVRATRLVAAWLNDTDRTDNNTLIAVDQDQVVCYYLDFNSCLGSWNGRPKEPWRGWRYAWDVEYQILGLLTLGLLPNLPNSAPLPRPAVGSFDLLTWTSARAWRAQNPNSAFDRLTQADAAWIARRMAAISLEQLRAVVASAGLSDPDDAAAVLQMLVTRRESVLRAWGLEALLTSSDEG